MAEVMIKPENKDRKNLILSPNKTYSQIKPPEKSYLRMAPESL